MAIKFITCHRRGTAQEWAERPDIIPEAGEIVIEIDEEKRLHKLKIGDGHTHYVDLKYLMAGDEIVTQVLAKALPRIVTVILDVNKWEETESHVGYYKQIIEINDITQYSRLDLQPDAEMLAEFKDLDLVFVTENKDGVITAYSVGDKPSKSYTMQATIVEADVEESCDKVIGMPVGTPTSMAEIKNYATTLNSQLFDEIGGGLSEVAIQDINLKTLSERLALIENFMNYMEERVTLVDINYSSESYSDEKHRLSFLYAADAENYASKNQLYRNDMSEYGAGVPSLKTTRFKNMEYTGNVILGSQFAIELYGKFSAGEILNSSYYSIELKLDDNGFFTTWIPLVSDTAINSSNKYSLDKAHHIMVVGNINTYSLYVDGELAGSKSMTLLGNIDLCGEDNNIFIGGNSKCATHLIRFRIFDTTLTDHDVKTIYNSYNPIV